MTRRPPKSPLFPPPPLSRPRTVDANATRPPADRAGGRLLLSHNTSARPLPLPPRSTTDRGTDRKSTRLNSSHLVISYAVFCLKKKKRRQCQTLTEVRSIGTW